MQNETIFGLTREQIARQSGSRDLPQPPPTPPINPGETLEPCIRGGQKILADPKKREMMCRIYRGK